jgi:hypothetical protein
VPGDAEQLDRDSESFKVLPVKAQSGVQMLEVAVGLFLPVLTEDVFDRFGHMLNLLESASGCQ